MGQRQKPGKKAEARTGAAGGAAAPGGGWFKRWADLRLPGGIGLGLGLLILLAYWNSFYSGLVLDNSVVIAQDPRIQSLDWDKVKFIFLKNYWWPYLESNLYRPLTTLSYLFNYTVLGGGERVFGYHMVNFLLHWANAGLVMVVVRRLSGRLDLAALTAAIFAVLPVNTESVTNIVGRADLLVTWFILLGGWCYMRAAAATGGARGWWLAGTGLSTCLGVMAKENAVMIFAFVLLYDWLWRWPALPAATGPARLKLAFREFALKGWVALVPGIVILWLVRRWLTFNTPTFAEIYTDNPISRADAWPGFMTAMKVMGRYLGLLVYPQTLSSDYSYNQIPIFGEAGSGEDWQSWAALAVVAGLLGLAWYWRRSRPLFTWGVGFFFLAILPTSNVLFPIGSIMGERFLYLPSIGFCAVAAMALLGAGQALAPKGLQPEIRRGAVWFAPGLVLLVFAARTFVRNDDWRSNVTLWTSAAAASPNSFKAHKGLASAQWVQGNDDAALDAAITEAELALAMLDKNPLPIDRQDNSLFQDLGMYYRFKGESLEQHNQKEDARKFYEKAVAILDRAREVDQWVNQKSRETLLARGFPADRIHDVGLYRIYVLQAVAYAKLGNWTKMEEAGRYVERLAPGETIGYILTGGACYNLNRVPEAAVEYMQALLIDHSNTDAVRNLAECYRAMGLNPIPISQVGANTKLDPTVPLVRQQINQAAGKLVQHLVEARNLEEAKSVHDTLVDKFQVPRDSFLPIQ